MIVGRNRVGDIVLFRRPSAGAAIAAVIEIEDAEPILADRLDLGCAIRGVGRIAVEIEDGRLIFLRRRMPGNQRDAVGRSISLTPSRPASAGVVRVGSGKYMYRRLAK